MTRRPLLSLCMIVRDGGDSLRRCLASARGVADETIVVDTGSADDSRQIASAAGAKVIEIPWDDDFAAARNVSLDAAHGEWILVLDADERLDPPSPRSLREELRRSKYLGYFLTVVSELAGGDRLDTSILRLFRHSPQVRFRYPIHEQVIPDLLVVAARTRQRFALLSDIQIVHEGYTPASIEAHGKVARNLRIFEKALLRHPAEAYLWFKYADFQRSVPGRRAEARIAAEKAFELLGKEPPEERSKSPFWSELLTILAACRLETGDIASATALLADLPPEKVGSPPYYYVAALVLEAAGRIDEALLAVGACIGAPRPNHLAAWRPEIVGPLGESLRARLLLRKGEAAPALASAERALALRPGFLPAVQLAADALLVAGQPGPALRLLMAELRRVPGEKKLWNQAGRLLERMGRPEEAKRCLARAQEPAPVVVAE